MMFGYKKEGEIHTLGQAGRLNCLQTWWVLPGDCVSLNYGGLFRMPNMRKYMWTPVNVKIFAFFTPAAWIFPNFRDGLNAHMKDPFNASGSANPANSFNGDGKSAFDADSDTAYQWIDGNPSTNGSQVRYSNIARYNYVWNEWFRDINLSPKFRTDIAGTNFALDMYNIYGSQNNNKNLREYGQVVANLPDMFSMINANSDEVENYYQTDITADELDLVELQQQAQTIKSQQEYYTMAQRYRDQLAKKFEGASVSHEADPRPYFLGSHEMEFGGHDVDATADNIGETQGKSTGRLEFSLPETMFGEHGYLQLFIVPRFRPLYEGAKNPITDYHDYFPAEMLGVPEYLSQEKPVEFRPQEFFADAGWGASNSLKIPSGEVHRWGFSTVHRRFYEVEAGFPILEKPANLTDVVYTRPNDWNRMFISQSLGNYSVQSQFFMNIKSTLPPSSASLFAGTNLGA